MTSILEAWGEKLQRELRAGVRRFSSVQAVLMWFLEQRIKRMGRSIDLSAVGTPRNPARVDQVHMTYAAILPCLVVAHPADLPEEPLAYARDPQAARVEAERRIGELTRWYATTNGQNGQHQRLADELGMSTEACERYCRAIARVLRRRMESAGLLTERESK